MAGAKNGSELHPTTLELAQGANFAAITTAMPDGKFQTRYIWSGTDGERLFVNTETHRQEFRNVERDPRVTLTILDNEDPYHYAEVRGEVVETVRGPERLGRAFTKVQRTAVPGGPDQDRARDAVDGSEQANRGR